jgi:UDP-N-acetylglucosamine 2-epimerase
LDALATTPVRSFTAFVERFGFADLRPGYVLTTLHPESTRPELTAPMADAMLRALAESGRQVVLTYPNADPGSDAIIASIEAAAGSPDFHVVRGFGADWYPTAMEHAGLMVGNSSGGIIEAASFGLPVVDIGDRQKGREHGPNVLHCGRDRSAIRDAIATATDPSFASRASGPNIYGDGRGAERVIAALRATDPGELGAPKRFAEPDPAFTGSLMELP